MSNFTFSKEQLLTLNQLVQALPLSERRTYLENLGETWGHLQRSEDFCVDERDYNIYSVVRIGDQCWLGENLRYKGGRYQENPDNPNLFYGCFYDWTSVMNIDKKFNIEYWKGGDVQHRGIAPLGWHIPSDGEWKELEAFLIQEIDEEELGEYLKSSLGWKEGIDLELRSSFEALATGYYRDRNFKDLGEGTIFWTATEKYFPDAWYRYLVYDEQKLGRFGFDKSLAYPIRCVKDK